MQISFPKYRYMRTGLMLHACSRHLGTRLTRNARKKAHLAFLIASMDTPIKQNESRRGVSLMKFKQGRAEKSISYVSTPNVLLGSSRRKGWRSIRFPRVKENFDYRPVSLDDQTSACRFVRLDHDRCKYYDLIWKNENFFHHLMKSYNFIIKL